jgi:lysophospholipase L1-like esterase
LFERYVALGDSQTEGVGDDPYPNGVERGWADRFAELLAAKEPNVLYANLAVRGRRIADVYRQQVAPAVALQPDLVSVIVGVNDIINPRFEIDACLQQLDTVHRDLRRRGATVITTVLPDVSAFALAGRLLSGRIEAFNDGIRSLAARQGSLVLDDEAVNQFADPGLWCADRLHFNPEGHRRFAYAIAHALGVSDPLAPRNAPGPTEGSWTRVAGELRWVGAHLLPWMARKALGRSSGDDRHPKRPLLQPVSSPLAGPSTPAPPVAGSGPGTW